MTDSALTPNPSPACGRGEGKTSVPHQRLDVVDGLGRGGGQHLVALGSDQHVVLDADADPLPALVQLGF
ncbi:hypothetical protein RZS08_19065, partial [Arthrospira platensis SPKY1]|nr:hypothetical protein [Arthrospira platensis SPKY1]